VFKDEIVPIEVIDKTGIRVIDTDESPRPGTTRDALAKLRPAFRTDGGTVTAGNSSSINDGASAVIVMSARQAAARGLEPLGRVESYASAGVEPKIMGIGAAPAAREALGRAGLELSDIDLLELGEAFAAQSLAVMKELDLEPDRLNPHGGAIALGHPIGASGGRILVTLLHEMRRSHRQRGLAALCVGGGQGQAMIVSNGIGVSTDRSNGAVR
jgi:acetyl-CoA C-acetyltransferase